MTAVHALRLIGVVVAGLLLTAAAERAPGPGPAPESPAPGDAAPASASSGAKDSSLASWSDGPMVVAALDPHARGSLGGVPAAPAANTSLASFDDGVVADAEAPGEDDNEVPGDAPDGAATSPPSGPALGNQDANGSDPHFGPHCDEGEEVLFPGSFFDQNQLRHGAVILYFVFAFYGFCVIALVCENYFLPTVEIICEELGLAPDIAAATFMSLASSAPELFVNVVTTFLTKSTMGVGTTVGSATFNVLGLASFIGLAARGPIEIRAGPVLRDSLLYVSAIAVTTCVVWDGDVQWYEALVMVLCSLAYMLFMFSHHSLARWVRKLVSRGAVTESLSSVISVKEPMPAKPMPEKPEPETKSVQSLATSTATSTSTTAGGEAAGCWPCTRRFLERVWFVVSWPVTKALALTIVDSKNPKLRRFFLLTFILCVVWIALAAYVVSWMLAVIGKTFAIPDAVMGITLLAAGGSTPEAVSAIIMSRKGVGSVGISNGLGANTLNMLMNLGAPWLVRSLLYPGAKWTVLSDGLTIDLVALVSAVVLLNIILALGRSKLGLYRLGRTQGFVTFGIYLLFIVGLVLIELNVFGFFKASQCA